MAALFTDLGDVLQHAESPHHTPLTCPKLKLPFPGRFKHTHTHPSRLSNHTLSFVLEAP